MMKIVAVSSLLVILSVVACGGGDPPETAGIHKGNVAVDFSLKALDGTEVSLSDYRGNVVLVNFWATWCPPCRAEIPDIEAAYQERQQDGLVVLGVSVEQTHASVEPFVQAEGMTYPVLLDEGRDTWAV
jgi:peroxiredoxin